MADLEALWADVVDDAAEDIATGRRAVCEGCSRPSSACLCSHLPSDGPLETSGALFVLTHPNESKRALNTGWILPRCMRRCEIITGRYPPNEMQDRLAACDVPVYLLYPSSTAVDLDEVSVASDAKALVQNEGTASKARAASIASDDILSGASYVCVCIDSTWGQAREMAVPTLEKLPERTRLIQLPLIDDDDDDDAAFDAAVDAPGLRRFSGDEATGSLLTPPAPGAMLTAEAAARAVATLESTCGGTGSSSASGGAGVAEWCVGAVRAMARFQARHDPAMSGGAVKRGGGRRQRLADPSRLEGAAGRAL